MAADSKQPYCGLKIRANKRIEVFPQQVTWDVQKEEGNQHRVSGPPFCSPSSRTCGTNKLIMAKHHVRGRFAGKRKQEEPRTGRIRSKQTKPRRGIRWILEPVFSAAYAHHPENHSLRVRWAHSRADLLPTRREIELSRFRPFLRMRVFEGWSC